MKLNKEIQYDLTTFLELELKRLTILDQLFSKKIPNTINFPQTEILIQKQTTDKTIMLKKLNNILEKKESPFFKNMSEMFDNYFS